MKMNIAQKIRDRISDFKESRRQNYAANRIIKKRAWAEYYRAKETAAKTVAAEKAARDVRPVGAKIAPFLQKVSKGIDKNRRAAGVQPVKRIKTVYYSQGARPPQTRNPYAGVQQPEYEHLKVRKVL